MARRKLRVGIVGVGGMGGSHCNACGRLNEVKLTAVCDIDPDRAQEIGERFGVPHFVKHRDLLKSGLVDGIIIGTPHYFHPPIAIDAFKTGLHVLSEKPIAVRTSQAVRMVRAAEKSGKVFAAMFQRRTEPTVRAARRLVERGVLGEVTRTLMIFPTFRSQAYYNSGGWRATWDGEGGGPLLNQSPHTLDMFTLLGGMPSKVTGVTRTLMHDIEVEDDAEALLEYPNGACGYFYASTCEPGPGHLIEIVGDKGKLRLQDETLTVHRYKGGIAKFNRVNKAMWGAPKAEEMEIKLPEGESGHGVIIRNWARAILYGEKLIAPGADGVRSVELANAVQLSSWKGEPVKVPINRRAYDRALQNLRDTSTLKKKGVTGKRETDPRIK